MAKELNSENFDSEVKELTLVDFWAPWCGPCRAQAPILEVLEKENAGIRVAKVNVDENEELAIKYGVRSIPTLIVFENGEPKAKAVGTQSLEDLKKLISL